MAKLDDIQTVQITSDPASYSTFIYGPVKIGKSTFVHKLHGKRVLMLMTEYRERGLVGAEYVRIKSWAKYLEWMRALNTKEARERYDVIAIDTVDNLWDMVNHYVADKWQEGVVGERTDTWGQDWTELKKSWNDGLQLIQKAGLTPYFIGHSQQKTIEVPLSPEMEKDKDALEGYKEIQKGKDKYLEFLQYQPDLPEKAMNPINKMVDQILYMSDMVNSKGESERVIHTRGNHQWVAGSTFEKIAPVVKLDPNAFKQAMTNAINQFDESEQTDQKYQQPEEQLVFTDLMSEAKELGVGLAKAGKQDDLSAIVSSVFGNDAKLMDATPNQVEQLQVAIMKMKEAA